MPKSVQRFLDEHQWKGSEFGIHMEADPKEFMRRVLEADYAVPVYVVRNWAVAHFVNRIECTNLKAFVFDDVVSLDTEAKYLACGLFQEPMSIMHRYIKSGKTITLSFRPELDESDILSRKNVKHKELVKPLKFLVEVSRRKCRIYVYLRGRKNGNGKQHICRRRDSGQARSSASTGTRGKARN